MVVIDMSRDDSAELEEELGGFPEIHESPFLKSGGIRVF